MKKIVTIDLAGKGWTEIYTNKAVKSFRNNVVLFDDGSLIDGDAGTCKFNGSPDSYRFEPTNYETVRQSFENPKSNFGAIKVSSMIVHNLGEAPITMEF